MPMLAGRLVRNAVSRLQWQKLTAEINIPVICRHMVTFYLNVDII